MQVRLDVDIRDTDDQRRDSVMQAAFAAAKEIGARRKCGLHTETVFAYPAATSDAKVGSMPVNWSICKTRSARYCIDVNDTTGMTASCQSCLPAHCLVCHETSEVSQHVVQAGQADIGCCLAKPQRSHCDSCTLTSTQVAQVHFDM